MKFKMVMYFVCIALTIALNMSSVLLNKNNLRLKNKYPSSTDNYFNDFSHFAESLFTSKLFI